MSNAGSAYIYEWDGTAYVFQNKLVASDRQPEDNYGIDVSIYGEYAIVGSHDCDNGIPSSNQGSAYLIQWDGTDWVEISKLVAFDASASDRFGLDVAIHENHLAIGSSNNSRDESGTSSFTWGGAVYMYTFDGVSWSFNSKIVGADRLATDFFGTDVDLFEDYLVVGARGQDLNELGAGPVVSNAGKAYIYHFDDPNWTELQRIIAPDRDSPDRFGTAVGIHGKRIIAGAWQEQHDDVGPLYDGAPLTDAGSVYFYELDTIADEPILAANNVVCNEGGTVTISVVGGDLHDASYWEWYADDCESEPIGTGDSIVVTVDGPMTICARGIGECDWFIKGDCGCITLDIEEGYWHKQTVDGMRDAGNDIITDADGNVYMVGEYYNATTFLGGIYSSVTIASGEFDRKSYLAKYDNCGNLLWVAYSISTTTTDDDFASSVTLDESNGYVYVGGNFHDQIKFYSGVGDFGVGPLPTNLLTTISPFSQGYVARFDMDNGTLHYMETVNVNDNTEINALTINKLTGNLFVGGQAGPTPGADRMFVRRYNPAAITLGPPVWQVDGLAYDQENLMDMAYNENTANLWLIGDYSNSFSVFGVVPITTGLTDAFVVKINDAIVPSLGGLKGGNISGSMWGHGISVNSSTGNVYLTGSYEGVSPNLFGTGQSLSVIYSTYRHAYFMAMDAGFGPLWPAPRWAAAFTGVTEGADVAFNEDGYACFVGTYTHAALNFSLGTTLPYVVWWSSGGIEPHLFAVSYDELTGAFNWDNATTDPVSNTGRHLPTAVAADPFGNSFVSGGFKETMGYMSGAPYSGNLFTPTQLASFTMRVQSSTGGAMQMPGSGTVEGDDVISHFESVSSSSEFEITTYPNPVTELVNVRVAGFDANENGRLTVLNLDGKVVMDMQINVGQTDLDFSNLDAGVYLIKVVNGSKTAVQRIVKS